MAVEAPRDATSELLGGMARLLFSAERCLYCVDAANVFDPYAFSRRARQHGFAPQDMLDRIFVTRCFTIHQLHAVVHEMLPPPCEGGGVAPVVALLGVDHLFLEQTLPARERALLLGQTMARLETLRASGNEMLLTHEVPPSGERWWGPLLEAGTIRGKVHRPPNGNGYSMTITRYGNGTHSPDIQHLSAGGDRDMAALSPGPAR